MVGGGRHYISEQTESPAWFWSHQIRLLKDIIAHSPASNTSEQGCSVSPQFLFCLEDSVFVWDTHAGGQKVKSQGSHGNNSVVTTSNYHTMLGS